MKSVTERKLLLALLFISLAPVLMLGFVALAKIRTLGEELITYGDEALESRIERPLLSSAAETADNLSRFLHERVSDIIALTMMPRSAEVYATFAKEKLAPVTAVDSDGSKSRLWFPLFKEISFIAASGAEVAAARDLTPVPEGRLLLHEKETDPFFKRVFRMKPGEVYVGPMHSDAGSKTLIVRMITPAFSREGTLEGAIVISVDPAHMREIAFHSGGLSAGESGEGLHGDVPHGIFFDTAGNIFAGDPEGQHKNDFLDDGSPFFTILGEINMGKTGIIRAPLEGSDNMVLAYAPIVLNPAANGGVGVYGGVSLHQRAFTAGDASLFSKSVNKTISRSLVQVGVLCLLAAVGLGMAAYLTVRRIARPWSRLREKAEASGGRDEATPDDLSAISRSFDRLADRMAESDHKLKASEQRFREFIEMTPDGIIIADEAGRILHNNKAFSRMLRVRPAKLHYATLPGAHLDEDDWERLMEKLRAATSLKHYEAPLTRADGSKFPALFTLRLANHGGSGRIEAVIRDISELKDAQEKDRRKTETLFRVYGELNKAYDSLQFAYEDIENQVREKTMELRHAYEALQNSDQVKNEFLMKMSHELRTPLNCIIGYSEAMIEGLDGEMTPEQAKSLGRIAQSGRMLLRLIEDLLDLSRIEAGELKLEPSAVDLNSTISEVSHQTERLLADKQVKLVVEAPEDIPPVWADQDRLRQVLFNLVGNAAKHTDRGEILIRTTLNGEQKVTVDIIDTGQGIPADSLEKVFDKFSQIPGPNTKGAGLGLSICKDLVESMGGEIKVTSEIGKGSRFSFSVPLSAW